MAQESRTTPCAWLAALNMTTHVAFWMSPVRGPSGGELVLDRPCPCLSSAVVRAHTRQHAACDSEESHEPKDDGGVGSCSVDSTLSGWVWACTGMHGAYRCCCIVGVHGRYLHSDHPREHDLRTIEESLA